MAGDRCPESFMLVAWNLAISIFSRNGITQSERVKAPHPLNINLAEFG